ncbi:MAG TPA: hypothetical protein VGP33_00370 [Chloroflexota bacterium]|jgi:hypothetical protein|nr:hypothetical protein [Chloroflexota bacterium]
MKPIRLSAHARGYLDRRGCTEEEIRETIRMQTWQKARMGRHEAQQDFPRNGSTSSFKIVALLG